MFEQVDGKPFIPSVKRTYANETLKTIHNRKSVRHFTNDTVSKAQLELLVRAGMAAPSAVNRQSWAFYVVTDKATLKRLSEKLPYGKMLAQAQAAIVVCGDMDKAGKLKDKDYWVHDCAAASENILLAAESIGLGAVWTAAFPYDDRTIAVVKELNLPENHIPLNVIPIGYPTGEDQAKDKWKLENLIWK
ncbi:nitroreductase family protein [Lentimicrobium sp. L6]|nr:nitroreductase family protein [Lentimicrobium sp. S6]NPD85498.1 nitroreductase family protein [Lentimicrobium sp. L6]